jgi:hypothetical protein
MPFTDKDKEKLERIAKVLGSAMADLQELTDKYDSQPVNRKRRNLKQDRTDKYEYMFNSGKIRRT